MKTIKIITIVLLSAFGLSNASDARTKCELLDEKISHATREELKIAAEGLDAYIELREIEKEKLQEQGWIPGLMSSARRGHQLMDFHDSHLGCKTSLALSMDDVYDLELESYGTSKKEGDKKLEEIEQRQSRAQECLECLRYLISKGEVAEYERES